MQKKIIQFGFKDFTPPDGVFVVDCRQLPNPYNKTDSDEILIEKVRSHPMFPYYVKKCMDALISEDTIYVGCYGGKHRSAAVAREASQITGAVVEVAGRGV